MKRNRHLAALALIIGALLPLSGAVEGAVGKGSLSAGIAAYHRQAYVKAATIFGPLADKGNARAQTYLGFMYANGWGVPQNYETAARWYEEAARRGDALAQYLLGLSYDKGQGVTQDYVTAYAWLAVAVAHVAPRDREYWTRIRDAVRGKLTLAQVTLAQRLIADWDPARR